MVHICRVWSGWGGRPGVRDLVPGLVPASTGDDFFTPPVAPPGPSTSPPRGRRVHRGRQTSLRSFMMSEAFAALGTGVFRARQVGTKGPGGEPVVPRAGTCVMAVSSRRARISVPPLSRGHGLQEGWLFSSPRRAREPPIERKKSQPIGSSRIGIHMAMAGRSSRRAGPRTLPAAAAGTCAFSARAFP
jgi:hypothetical protein